MLIVWFIHYVVDRICTGKDIKITANCINNTYAKVTYSGAVLDDITTLVMACYNGTEVRKRFLQLTTYIIL